VTAIELQSSELHAVQKALIVAHEETVARVLLRLEETVGGFHAVGHASEYRHTVHESAFEPYHGAVSARRDPLI
jgi:hypothetical protein